MDQPLILDLGHFKELEQQEDWLGLYGAASQVLLEPPSRALGRYAQGRLIEALRALLDNAAALLDQMDTLALIEGRLLVLLAAGKITVEAGDPLWREVRLLQAFAALRWASTPLADRYFVSATGDVPGTLDGITNSQFASQLETFREPLKHRYPVFEEVCTLYTWVRICSKEGQCTAAGTTPA